jgi:hypothetical protein
MSYRLHVTVPGTPNGQTAGLAEPLSNIEAARPKRLAAAIEPLLVDTDRAAAICGVSTASWFRLKSAGKTPEPVRLGGRVLYRVEDLKLWVALGCPDRKTFEARKAAANADGRPR